MKKLLLLFMMSMGLTFFAHASAKGQVISDFLYENTYQPVDTVLFSENDSLVVGDIVLLENDSKETQIQLKVKYGDKTSYYFVFVDHGKLRVAQEKVFDGDVEVKLPIENVIYFPRGKGKIQLLNYNTSLKIRDEIKLNHFAMIMAFIEKKLGMKIKY